jgi:3-deoxy-D-manno-octulosonic-acid transferase
VEDKFSTREKYRSLLGIENEIAFICGSTRTGEEELLSKVFLRLREESKQPVVWIVAPRHLERLKELKMLFKKLGLGVDLYSEIKSKKRSHPVILIDCIGELAQLYAAGDYNFCGGSLVDKGGHNIMEAIRFGKPVYFGPSMKDFHDAVKILKPIGAGFQVSDVDALTNLFLEHMHNKNLYEDACRAAAEITAIHHGAAKRQADMVTQLLAA